MHAGATRAVGRSRSQFARLCSNRSPAARLPLGLKPSARAAFAAARAAARRDPLAGSGACCAVAGAAALPPRSPRPPLRRVLEYSTARKTSDAARAELRAVRVVGWNVTARASARAMVPWCAEIARDCTEAARWSPKGARAPVSARSCP
eukprot:CAMPEP_0184377036 /NCGR_PEP_ID=MMETSP0007-20130409/1931_1 /TAXON_ID=97485 /ORGANISM="Prymnesium parvum, Strain Texoma1" /LENGTH=148 /DNA_ID=CAMNT_0026720787 /DNA_START=410 /DNA_END=857 /DNA_ORIENTATION=-